MYLSYWGLRERPFENTPDPRFMYYSVKHKEALLNLLYAVSENKGAALLTGDIGCGKTLIARTLISKLDPEEYEIALVTNPLLGEDDLLREILYQFGIESGELNRIDILHHLNDFLFRNAQKKQKSILIIDEAQLIKDELVLEEIRLLLNFQLNDQFLLTLILLGQPELETKLKKIPQLDQRIGIRYNIEPLSLEDTGNFITHRLRSAGKDEVIFDEEAVSYIYRYSEGIPRKINTICDLSLVMGAARNLSHISKDIIQELTQSPKTY